MIKADGKVSALRVKMVREQRQEGASGSQRVVIVQMAMHHTPELLEFLAANIDNPVKLSMTAKQRELAEGDTDADGDGDDAPGKPKARLVRGGARAGN